MNVEEARAQFPVLERFAYLNAGTNGPVPRASADAIVEQTLLDLERGRSGSAWFERILALREEARVGLAAVIGADPSLVALTESTSRGCSIVLSGLGLGPDDEVVITIRSISV
jgi:L-cysteine/cystine lyase